MWLLGRRDAFNARGEVPVATMAGDAVRPERAPYPAENLLLSTVSLAALFHDLGKAFVWFQTKINNNLVVADAIRHELLSFGVMRAMLQACAGSEDAWLARLADPVECPRLIEAAYRLFSADPLQFIFSGKMDGDPIARLRRIANKESPALRGMSPAGIDGDPRFSAVAALVLTHHRLPGGRASRFGLEMTADRLVSVGPDAEIDASTWRLPRGQRGVWTSREWIRAVSAAASGLLREDRPSARAHFRILMDFGRTALIMGDHSASAAGSSRLAPADASGRPFANTNRNGSPADTGKPAEFLDSHCLSVARRAHTAARLLVERRGSLPSVERSFIPEGVRAPRGDKGGRYRWQFEAAKAVRDASPKDAFFGVVIAGTGSGKTRAAPQILCAALGEEEGLRFTLASGLRTLTLQSGDAYRREIGFQDTDLAVVIGDTLAMELHRLRQKEASTEGAGTDAEDPDKNLVVPLGDYAPPMPAVFERYFDRDGILPTPILVATIDTIMSAADARAGRHTEAMMRIASSDLVIDEIDNFNDEDRVAIARLCRLCGSFGRRLLISSATIDPILAVNLFASYLDGWRAYAAAFGRSQDVSAGWFSEFEGTCTVESVADAARFRDVHEAFVNGVVERIKKTPARRRARFVNIDTPTDMDDYFTKVNDVVLRAHALNHVIDPSTGKRLSVGMVRWSNVAPAMLNAVHLIEQGVGPNVTVKVMSYNASLLPVVRERYESALDAMLTRKGRNDPILKSRIIRDILDDPATKEDAMVLIVTTMEDVGRDHDYDWAVVDPGPHATVVQIAGRVRRHRYAEWTNPNVFIMEYPFRWHHRQWGQGGASLVHAYPGVETPLDGMKVGSDFSRSDRFELPTHRSSELFPGEFRERIDASDILRPGSSIMVQRTLFKSRMCMEGGYGLPLSALDFCSEPLASVTDFHPANRRFRRSAGTDQIFEHHVEGRCEGDWFTSRAMDSRRTRLRQNDLVSEIGIDRRNLLIHLSPIAEEVRRMLEDLGHDDENPLSWRRLALTSIRRNVKDLSRSSFSYHSSVGFCDLTKFQ